MKHLELAKYIDHTLLNPSATPNDILTICEEAKHYKTASVCVNSCYVPLVHQALLGSGVMTCCVVGFPLGAMSTEAKAEEARLAVQDGAEEIDMVQNIGYVKAGEWTKVEQDTVPVGCPFCVVRIFLCPVKMNLSNSSIFPMGSPRNDIFLICASCCQWGPALLQ